MLYSGGGEPRTYFAWSPARACQRIRLEGCPGQRHRSFLGRRTEPGLSKPEAAGEAEAVAIAPCCLQARPRAHRLRDHRNRAQEACRLAAERTAVWRHAAHLSGTDLPHG